MPVLLPHANNTRGKPVEHRWNGGGWTSGRWGGEDGGSCRWRRVACGRGNGWGMLTQMERACKSARASM
eukprot:3195263-Prorocentrum_lima.AAC.1